MLFEEYSYINLDVNIYETEKNINRNSVLNWEKTEPI